MTERASPRIARLAEELDAVIAEHRHCGDLDGDVTDGADARVWFSCDGCGARIVRMADARAESA